MKVLYRVGLIFVCVCGLYFCYRYASLFRLPIFSVSDLKKTQIESPVPIIQNITVDPGGNVLKITEDVMDTDLPVAGLEDTLTSDTKYIVKRYDQTTKQEDSLQQQIPDQFIGKTRTELEDIVQSYNMAPSLEDLEQGFVSMEISSFSPSQLVVVKKYISDMSKEHFYLIAENNYITVYYSDLATVYLYTDISFDMLPGELQQQVLDKKYVDSEEELYNFLESYSS